MERASAPVAPREGGGAGVEAAGGDAPLRPPVLHDQGLHARGEHVGPRRLLLDRPAQEDPVCRGTWARVTIDQFRHWAPQTFKKHMASSNIFSNKMFKYLGRSTWR